MTPEELEISRSTPGYRFDSPAPAQPAPPAAAPGNGEVLDDRAAAFVDETLRDHPVVMFALEWCEFCWAVRKLFGELGVDYHAVDLDSVAYQEGDRGGRIRAVLRARLGSNTIPQVFVGGQHLGGATDTFEACKSGDLQARLDAAGVAHGDLAGKDPFQLLPNWLHAR